MSEKIKIGDNPCLYPMPMTLVGAKVAGKPNFMAAAWVARVNYKPALFAVALNQMHYTPEGIVENKTYSINIPGQDMLETTDYCGLVSGRSTDKSKVFDVFYGETGTAPMIGECPLAIECRLVNTVDLPSNRLFIGEVVAAYSEERYLTDGEPDVKKIRPFVLTMPDNHYWGIGECLGKAWNAGKKLKRR
jgi:flavin reductase (DIM6/NTAB) family NADH-FMN oxidoreductase RutF